MQAASWPEGTCVAAAAPRSASLAVWGAQMLEEVERPAPASTYTVIRSRAPLRISFCGGGTDVPPYPERHGGCVLSCTIDKYAYVSTRKYDSAKIKVRSEDFGVELEFDGCDRSLSGKLDIAQAIFHRFSVMGLECHLQSDAPPGSGLGSSSAMIVALIYAMARHKNIHLTASEVAELAVAIERGDLGILGGLQDQYASAFGGFNFIEFSRDGVLVTPLRIRPDIMSELHYHLLLCYTGRTRLSSNIIVDQIRNVESSEGQVMHSLERLKSLTHDLKSALLNGKIFEFGEILDEAWSLKRNLAHDVTNGSVDELYAVARSAGALGGKLLGAGGGGYLLVCVPFPKRRAVREALGRAGACVVDFQFDESGVQTWGARPDTWR